MSSPSQTAPQPAETQAKGILLVRELCKSFSDKKRPEVKALDSVSFVVHRGRITGLVGADGAGKTTLIRISAGLLVPTSGNVTVLGRDSVADTLEIQSRVGYMPQKFGLYQDLTVAENMTLYADLQGVAGTERTEKFTRLLQMTSLGAYTGRRAGALSGGMKQKLGLACALIKSPEILLLDEPTVGVDPVSRRELWKIVNELVERDGIGVLVSTAYLDEAEKCDQVVVLHEGKVLAEGTPGAFIKPMAGRTLLLDASPDRNVRTIYTHLSGRADSVDVTIRSGKVRTVLAENVDATTLTDTLGPIAIHQAQPTFEDAFMALIPRSDHQHQPSPMGSTHPGHDQEEIVRTDNLQKLFGTFEAVKKLTFTVRRGEIFGLLGPNGAGKSTTFRMLCGLLPASGGEISVAGHDLRRSRARARSRLGYMAQQFSLYGQLTTRETLGFFGKAYGLSGKRLKTRIEWAFAEFSLTKWAGTPAGALPGGNKQRLAMAVALLHEPDILFLDEPTSGVDPGHHRGGHHPFHGRGGILRSDADHEPGRHARLRHTDRNSRTCEDRRQPAPHHG